MSHLKAPRLGGFSSAIGYTKKRPWPVFETSHLGLVELLGSTPAVLELTWREIGHFGRP